jgi:hypothetical protein
MSERAPYSRVYWSIVDDEKFRTVFDDDGHLATWLRLLMSADQAWPASANVPAALRKRSLEELVRVKIVDLVPGGRFRIRGLDAERTRRKLAATSRDSKPEPSPDGDHSGTTRGPNGFGMQGLSRAEPSKAEPSRAEEDEWDILDVYFRLTGSPPRSQGVRDFLSQMSERFGAKRFGQVLASEYAADRALGTLIGRARDRLAVEDHNAERDERAAEKARIAANRRPLTFVKPPDYDAISDEEAERQADELLGRSAS